MPDEKCPKCQSDSMLTVQYSLVVSFENWEWLMAFFVLVFCFSIAIKLPVGFALIAAWLATVPVIMSLRRKCFCERCEIEFCSSVVSKPLPVKK